jgi:hypothetical protein
MSHRFVARALVVVALLGTTGVAAANPVAPQVCVPAGCVSLSPYAGPGGTNAGVSVSACPPATVSTGCADLDAGGGLTTPLPDVPSGAEGLERLTHPFLAWCDWSGSAGSKVDIDGHLLPASVPGVTVKAVTLSCTLYENGVAIDSVSGNAINYNDTVWVHTANNGTHRGSHLMTCMYAGVEWSDGGSDAIATEGCGVLPT